MIVTLEPQEQKRLAKLAAERGESPQALARTALREGLNALEKNGAGHSGTREEDPAFEPSKTELGRKLRTLSRKYVEGGGKLYSLDEINTEIAEGRGER